MNKITLAQREALDVVKDMIDKSNTSVPDYGTKILTLILGILNIDCRVEHTTTDIINITDIEGGKTLPINPEDGNGKINLDVPEWIKNLPTPPFVPKDISHPDPYPPCPFPPNVWYNHEPEPIQTNAQEDVRFETYTGDFRDGQTSFNDK